MAASVDPVSVIAMLNAALAIIREIRTQREIGAEGELSDAQLTAIEAAYALESDAWAEAVIRAKARIAAANPPEET